VTTFEVLQCNKHCCGFCGIEQMTMKKTALAIILVISAALVIHAQTTQHAVPQVKVGSQLIAKAPAPTPGPSAKNTAVKTGIGKGLTSVAAFQPSSFWTEDLDVDDGGALETSDYLYDAQRGILYTYREDDFSCPNGNRESGSILMALYGKDNKENRPVGSGWYLVNVDAGKCAAKKSGTFGCKFDASGNATECGAASVNNATGEIEMVVEKQ
jgi:hypothetical protein